jgi:hypothetical protein
VKGLGFAVIALAMCSFATASDSDWITVTQTSPARGSTLTPGKVVDVAWTIQYSYALRHFCEQEVFASYDGGKTWYGISPELDSMARHFTWIVPNVHADNVILTMDLGCEYGNRFEDRYPQPRASFRIAGSKPTP